MHHGEGGATARVVDDVPDDALDVAVALAVVDGPQPGGALAVLGVALEDGAGALALGADDATHLGVLGAASGRSGSKEPGGRREFSAKPERKRKRKIVDENQLRKFVRERRETAERHRRL